MRCHSLLPESGVLFSYLSNGLILNIPPGIRNMGGKTGNGLSLSGIGSDRVSLATSHPQEPLSNSVNSSATLLTPSSERSGVDAFLVGG